MPLRQLFSSSLGDEAARVDIVAVHGLNPRSKHNADHAWNTWRKPQTKDGRLWLQDDLPAHTPEARIFLYEYNSTAVFGSDKSTFMDRATELLECLRVKRGDHEQRPLIFLGHSLGGLLVEQALVNAHNNPKYTSIRKATSGLAFFGTPHDGGHNMLVGLGKVTANIALSLGFQKGQNVFDVLSAGSIFSDILQEHWRHQLLSYHIISFWGSEDEVVPKESARFGLPGDREHIVKLNAGHSDICRFDRSLDDEDILEIVQGNIKDIYNSAAKRCELVNISSLGAEGSREENEAVGDPLSLEARIVALRALQVEDGQVSLEDVQCRQLFLQKVLKYSEGINEQHIEYQSHRLRNPARTPGTCTWFLEHPEYKQWRQDFSSGILWLSGDPGCGKSVLANFLVNELQREESQNTLSSDVCYFFFKDDNLTQSNALFGVRALLHQLISTRPILPTNLRIEFEAKGEHLFKSFDIVWRSFLSVLNATPSRNTICVLDGLDECEANSKRTIIHALTALFRSENLNSGGPCIKFLLTSRPENLIRVQLSKVPTIWLRGEDNIAATEHDIELVIKHQLDDLEAQGLDRQTKQLLHLKLVKHADQTFLWVSLIMALLQEAMEDGASQNELLAVLKDRSIDSLYAKFLERTSASTESRRKVERLLRVVVAAVRPLTLEEVDIAVSINPAHKSSAELQPDLHTCHERHIRKLCGHFVRCKGGRVYLAHQTARDFLLRHSNNGPPSYINLGPFFQSIAISTAHALLGGICQQYLLFKDVACISSHIDYGVKAKPEVKKLFFSTYPFLSYAAASWPVHVRSSEEALSLEAANLAKLLCNTRCLQFWSWFYLADHRWAAAAAKEISVINYFALGAIRRFSAGITPSSEENLGDSRNSFPGLHSVCNEVPEAGKCFPLEWAVCNGYLGVVRVIFEIAPNICRAEQVQVGSALHRIWRSIPTDSDKYYIARALIKHGAPVADEVWNAIRENDGTSLQLLADLGVRAGQSDCVINQEPVRLSMSEIIILLSRDILVDARRGKSIATGQTLELLVGILFVLQKVLSRKRTNRKNKIISIDVESEADFFEVARPALNAFTFWRRPKAEIMQPRQLISQTKIENLYHKTDDYVVDVDTVEALGLKCASKGDFYSAEISFRDALKLRLKLGEEHKNTLRCQDNLAVAVGQQGRSAEAERIHRKTLQGFEKILGNESPLTLGSMNNLGVVLAQQGKYLEALSLHRAASRGLENIFGPQHPETQACLENVLEDLQKLENLEKMKGSDYSRSEIFLG